MSDAPEPEPPEEEPSPAQKIAQVFIGAWTKAKLASLPDEHAGRHGAIDSHLEALEQEIAPLMGKVLGPYLESESLPPEWRAILGEAVEPTHTYGFLLAIAEFFGAMLAVLPALGKVLVQPYVNQAWQGAPSVPLSPADLADGVERQIIDPGYAASNAAMSGIAGDDFNYLVALTGEPPGPVDMLKLMLRGDATADEVTHAIRYSRIRNEFIPYVLKMAYTQMSPADAIMATIKEVVTPAQGAALFERGGGLAGDFDTLYQAAGDSIGIQQVLTLWKYGLTTEQEVNLALGRSRINPIFYPLAKLTHFHPLSAFQISKAIASGTVTPAQGEQWLIQNGTPADQAHALASAHSSTGTAKAHTETESMVTQAYDDHLITHTQANAALLAIGYHADVAALILDIADAKYALKQQGHAVSAIRAGYTSHHIARNQASNDLDALQVPAAARDHWLADWDLELTAHPKTLTAVQLATAGKDNFLTPPVVYARLQQEGYTAEDAKVLMQLHKAPLPPGV